MSATIGDELPAHPFFLATLFVPQSGSLPETSSYGHGFSKSWAEERNQARQSVNSWRCSPVSYLANESRLQEGA
jgi:hypothetical protein